MFENLKLMFRLVVLDKQAIEIIAKKKSATSDGVLVLFLVGLASIVGIRPIFETEPYNQLNFDFNLNNVLFLAIMFVVFSTLYFGLSFLIARSIGGNCKFKAYFRALSFANIMNILNIFMSFTIFTNMWVLILNYQILKKLNNFSPFKAFVTLLTTSLSVFALALILS